MKATWNNQTIAEADNSDIIHIEGNAYFPPDSINQEYFKDSDHHTTCHWKGEASYYHIEVDGKTNEDAAWYYPEPMDSGVETVKKDFTNYVAFWRGVEVS